MKANMTHNDIFGEAKWIAPTDSGICPLIRKDFHAEGVISASIDILGFAAFVFYINGKRGSEDYFLPLVTDFEFRNAPSGEITAHRAYVSHYDITHLLKEGRNSLAVLLGDGWYTGRTGMYEEVPYGEKKLCFKITVKTEKNEYTVISDTDSLWRESYVKQSDLNFGEAQDFTDYDDSLLTEEIDGEVWQSVCTARAPETNYGYSDCPPDRVIEILPAKKISERDGVALYDCGKNITGFPSITVNGYGGEIEVYFSEDLNESGELLEKSMHRQKMTYRVCGERRVLEPAFTWLGFRYFTVKGKVESVEVKRINCDIPVNSHFECDDETLNWLYNAFVLTELSNMHQGIPSDCPHIERRGYLGDGHLTCRPAMIMLDSRTFYEKWIGDISDSQDRISGHAQYTAPYTHSGGGPGGFSHGFIKIPYEYYLRYGDDTPLREMYGQFLEYLRYLEEHSEFDLVVSDKEGEWCLGEWCVPMDKSGDMLAVSDAKPGGTFIPPPFVNTVYYVKSLELMIKIADLLGKEEDIALFKDRIAKKKAIIKAAYFNPNNGIFAGNQQGGNAFALDIGLGDERTKKSFIAYYERYPYFDTGIFGTEIVTRLLFEYGRADIACKMLTADEPHGYGYFKNHGATTLWEYWKKPRSRSHPMFGAPAVFLFEYILGIRHAEGDAGYANIVIAPALNTPLRHASGYITPDKGRIAVEYTKENGVIKLTCSVPTGVNATVLLGSKKVDICGQDTVCIEGLAE